MINPASIPSLDDELPEQGSMSLTEIYNQLLTYGELILIIPAEEEDRLRKGLASVKAKATKKMQDQGLPLDKAMLSYQVTPAKEAGTINIQIVLGQRNNITVLGMTLPDNEI